jgi:protein-L-isoaspartate O-methyltransferase
MTVSKAPSTVGDGLAVAINESPLDAIYVGASMEAVPAALLQCLNTGGRLVCVEGPEQGPQYLMLFEKRSVDEIAVTRVYGGVSCPALIQRLSP